MQARKLVVGAVTTLACVLGTAAPALAWTVDRDGGALTARAGASTGSLTVSDGPLGIRFSEDAGRAFVGPLPQDCTQLSTAVVDCSAGPDVQVALAGSPANDKLSADTIRGGLILNGAAGDDTLSAGTAAARLLGGAGDDTLFGGAGADSLDGNDGKDQLFGASGGDVLTGGAGDDQIFGGAGTDTLLGGSDADLLDGGDGRDTLSGEAGNDTVVGNAGGDVLDGGEGDDVLSGGSGDDTLNGAAGRDRLNGEDGNDTLDGGEDDDALLGAPGDDVLAGGPGADTLEGVDGDDRLSGGDSDDRLDGGLGNDQLAGEAGNDTLDGREGADGISGGPGSDTVTYADRSAPLIVSLNDAPGDGVPGEGDNASSDIEQILGGSGPDTLIAGANGTTLVGNVGDDTLVGGPAADSLSGGAGDDRLDGASGPDTLSGGDGFDTVDYGSRTAAVSVTLGAPTTPAGEAEENDRVDDTVEGVTGGSGPDKLVGRPGFSDTLRGGNGDDRIQAGLGGPLDFVDCGFGGDQAEVDANDLVAGDCEIVRVNGQQVKPGVAPSLFLRTRALRMNTRGVVEVPIRCSAGARTACSSTMRVSLKIAGKRYIARGRLRLAPGGDGRVRVRFSARPTRSLKRRGGRRAATVSYVVADVLGRKRDRSAKVNVNLGRRAR